MEAVLAALYLERGLDELAGPVIEAFGPRIEEALTESVDQKTTLQEELAKRGQRVEYVTLGTVGPPHDRTFTCAALVDGEQVGTGTGRTKKDAEQEAARDGARPAWAACLAVPSASVRPLASPSRAPERDQTAWLQVVPRPGGNPARARRGRGRRAERLREVERLGRDRLGGRFARSVGAARREARRRALRRRGRAEGDRLLRGRAAVRQLGRRRAGRVLGALDLAAPAPRRRGPVPRQPHGRAPDRPRRAARGSRARRRDALDHRPGQGGRGVVVVARATARDDRRGRGARALQAPAPPRRAEAAARRDPGGARARRGGRGQEAAATARAAGDGGRARGEARRRDRARCARASRNSTSTRWAAVWPRARSAARRPGSHDATSTSGSRRCSPSGTRSRRS